MAVADIQNKVINKNNEGFPAWLDFDKLRREGMDYLGTLSGNLWTDHNTHDPGITILEMLCYALLDLGYRTSLPAADLFSRDPDSTGEDDNFFTPAQILGCNPLTILDYRRLLVDIEGVKNAWLTVAEDITIENICDPASQPGYYYSVISQPAPCLNFLNGLYHVYIDIEDNSEKDEVIASVKKALMAHRNLCEDFYDVTVLCRQKVGVCADIEIDNSVEPETIFLSIIEKLRDFISPSPQFYKLKQLLVDKGRSIEDIFAGRPFDLINSHGFVDTEEFEQIVLHKEIHISDVYNVLFNIGGVTAIRNIRLQNCDGSRCTDPNANWVFKLFENHVPEFSLDCSGFRITRNGVEIFIDRSKFQEYLNLNFSNSGKTTSKADAGLDLPVPTGVYRSDLADYYPLENDFPKVYGIAEGSLPAKASTLRKAQSLQLRGYLLFFDHLLAGYLSQLKNLRHLFALKSDSENQHTYFVNSSIKWPGLEKLLRYDITGGGAGSYGTTQAYPVDRQKLEETIAMGNLIDCDFENNLHPFLFCSAAERDIAINQLINDTLYKSFKTDAFETRNGCWFFYAFSSSGEFAIVGRGEYKTKDAALAAAEAIRFLCTDKKSYRSYIAPGKTKFSFNLSAGITSYWTYLQMLVENEQQYRQRRTAFLDHLLARFAETFTDFALLSYSFLSERDLQTNEIKLKENFLSSYPALSSNRGRAYDYMVNGWNNSNISGFEAKSSAYAGMGNGMQENLCHFEVAEYEEQSVVALGWNKYHFFDSEGSFDNREEAMAALHGLFGSLQDSRNYDIAYSTREDAYFPKINSGGSVFNSPLRFSKKEDAEQAAGQLQHLFLNRPAPEDIRATKFSHQIVVQKNKSDNKWTRIAPVITDEESLRIEPALLEGFPDKKIWTTDVPEDQQAAIVLAADENNPAELINTQAFDHSNNRVDVVNGTIIYQYSINDLSKTFFFLSEQRFEQEDESAKAGIQLLFLLLDPKNLSTEEDASGNHYIRVLDNGKIVATNTIEHKTREEAKAAIDPIVDYVNGQLYHATSIPEPIRWKFDVRLESPGHSAIAFTSNSEYDTYKATQEDAAAIIDPTRKFDVVLNKNNELEITDQKKPRSSIAKYIPADNQADLKQLETDARELLDIKKSIVNINQNPQAQEMEAMVVPDSISRQGNFGYRLVKKDDYHAWYDLDGDFTDPLDRQKKINEVFHANLANHNYLDICYGGDNIIERKDPVTGTTGYQYAIMSKHEMVLFISILSYDSPEEAQLAFEEDFVSILSAASDPLNYGVVISFNEKTIAASDRQSLGAERVFIPDDTMKAYGYNHQYAADKLSALAATYPIRSIMKTDPLFAKYFLCDPPPAPPASDDCGCGYSSTADTAVYYFLLQNDQPGLPPWISYNFFTTPREALKAFHFFLMLLLYKGNYRITYNQCDCGWRLYLREILAVSKRRFRTPDDAWGKHGVEKFICASQSKDAFHTYRDDNNCCYTFTVSCGNIGLIHPCKYDTPELRDRALKKLFKASEKLAEDLKQYTGNLYLANTPAEWEMLTNTKKRIRTCEDTIDTVNAMRSADWDDAESQLKIANSNDPQLAAGAADLRVENIKKFAYYFPIIRKKLDQPGEPVFKYYLEIKLPEFCEEDLTEYNPCGCGKDETNKGCSCCCTAWVSECCFGTCEEALRYLIHIAPCLADPNNYYPVFDCECGPYGIRFFCNCEDEKQIRQSTDPNYRQQDEIEPPKCCNEIVAYNPQCYMNSRMDCDAVNRSRNLINAEGLHLVEHILLRPHCTDGDCRCKIETCNEDTLCQFTWNLPADDPCNSNKSYCFVPGTDPYSFVATAVLPAWPERFRKKENRQLIEQLLYRELPAHVMLRVLWLTPHDLCHFEFLYRNWTKWLANKKVCGDHNAPCELIDFLFNRTDPETNEIAPFGCFECDDCVPCSDKTNPPDPCFASYQVVSDPNKYVNAINDLYCWPLICPGDRASTQMNLRIPQANIREVVAERTPAPPAEIEDHIEMERKVDKRFYGYREEIKTISENTRGNTNAGLAWSFVHLPAPEFRVFEDTVKTIIANKKTAEDPHPLTMVQKRALLKNVTWYYLDKLILDDKLDENKSGVKEIFRKLDDKDLLPEYKNWQGAELSGLKPDIPLHEIKKFFK